MKPATELLAAVASVAESGLTPEMRVRRALEEAFRDEGVLSGPTAIRTAFRFVRSIPLAEGGLDDEAIAAELGCSVRSLWQAREHVARLAAGSQQLRADLLDDE